LQRRRRDACVNRRFRRFVQFLSSHYERLRASSIAASARARASALDWFSIRCRSRCAPRRTEDRRCPETAGAKSRGGSRRCSGAAGRAARVSDGHDRNSHQHDRLAAAGRRLEQRGVDANAARFRAPVERLTGATAAPARIRSAAPPSQGGVRDRRRTDRRSAMAHASRTTPNLSTLSTLRTSRTSRTLRTSRTSRTLVPP
jgi:hypothetical protein